MVLSKKIRQYMPHIKFKAVDEKSVDTLGFFDCEDLEVCCFVGAEKYIRKIPHNAKTLIIPQGLREKIAPLQKGLIIVDEPQNVFWMLHQNLSEDKDYVRPSFESRIAKTANIGKYVSISPKNVIIEENVVIEDFVTIYENTYIKKNSLIRSGCRLGGVGFQECCVDGKMTTINHYGGVIIGENVDIQNNSCVDRGLFPYDDTIIGDDTKIDNMVHIAHATKIGRRCEIAANAVIAGRCIVGDDIWIGLCASVRNFVNVGDNSRINIGSVVVNDVPANGSVSGNYAIDHNLFMFEQLRRSRVK